jgi:glycosyltransferase involved in cell wall biosynthesis
MRLLFVHDRLGAMAGAEVNLHLTAAGFKSRKHTLGLLHGPFTGKNESAWREIFPQQFPLTDNDTSAVTRFALSEFQPDAIYVHKMADPGVLETLAESGCPIVRMVHDHDLYCMRSYKYFPLTRRICTRAAGLYCIFPCGAVLARSRNNGLPFKWVSYPAKERELRINRRFHRMVVATDYMKQELLRNGFAATRIEIHAPVPATDEAVSESSFNDRNLILYAGQIIRGKGVDVLIEALSRVEETFECRIFGEGSHRSHCETLSRELGLDGKIRFEGYVPPDELRKFYADASLAVVSSVWPEPFCAAGLEAMRHGLPVVGFDAGGIREWLANGHNGFLVPWMDRAQFAESISRLLRDKALARKLGAQGRQFARERFGFTEYIDGLEEMFTRVINETRTGARP